MIELLLLRSEHLIVMTTDVATRTSLFQNPEFKDHDEGARCFGVNKLNDLQQKFSNQDNRWTKRPRQQITLLIPLSPAFIIAALTPSPAAASPLLFKPEGGLLLITIYHYLRNS